MDTPIAYIPIDRRHALANGRELPERTTGSALMADISGFTPLTEALALEFGPRRGAEELTVYINRVYDALIAELHRYGGSVIGFAGDAITCWIDGDDGSRAVTIALGMQQAMQPFASLRTGQGRPIALSIKVAVANGPVRRFVVGDPAYRRVDTMAGVTLERLAAAESLANKGEVVVDTPTANALAGNVAVSEWRDHKSGERYAQVSVMALDVPEQPWPELPDGAIGRDASAEWLLPPNAERLNNGHGEFLAELRPAYALFMRFSGIDYDGDPAAGKKLNQFVGAVQKILSRFDGSMIQLTIGDKGSYLYSAFGAPTAHEDDAIRAAATLIEFQKLPEQFEFLDPLQLGGTIGRMRVGAYGSATRRTYGVLGDAVNLSARLMVASKPGTILVSEAFRSDTQNRFVWERLPNMRVKGKTELISVSRLIGWPERRTADAVERRYQLPMVGRAEQLASINGKLDAVLHGKGQIVGISAEAGMGKSRLAAEVITNATREGLYGLMGECQSYGTMSSYLVWQDVWRGFFGLDAIETLEEQMARIETVLENLSPNLLARLPLLSAVLNLPIPDNDLTRSLDAKVRKASLEDLLTQCVQLRARSEPLLLVFEDCHWLDPVSRDLIGVIGKAIEHVPALLLLVYRPPDAAQEQLPPVTQLPFFTEVTLKEFTPAETQQLIELKLRQFFGVLDNVPAVLLERISTLSSGNPFYIEELLNYLKDLGVAPHDTAAIGDVDLPNTIHALVLSRIDRLNDTQQVTLKVASVIGRLFRAAMLWGAFPDLEPATVQDSLDILSEIELTPLDTPEPELTYLFRHIITQQVAYESLLHATRANLHEQIGQYIEANYPDTLSQFVNLLAYHYERTENAAKKRHYLLMAGDAAQKNFANTAAINYFEKALPLLEGRELIDTRLKLGHVLQFAGLWDEAVAQYDSALSEAEVSADEDAVAWVQTEHGELARKRNQYDAAGEWFVKARGTFESADNKRGVGQVLHYAGTLAAQQGDYVLANQRYNASLALRRELGDRENEANVLNNLGIVARYLGNPDAARRYHEESLAIQDSLGNKWTTAALLNNLGHMAIDQGDTTYARTQLERALAIWRDIGERWATTNTIHNLANVARDDGDDRLAQELYAECVSGWQGLNDRWALAYWLEDLSLYYTRQFNGTPSNPKRALELLSAADALRDTIGVPRPPAYQSRLNTTFEPLRSTLDEDARSAAEASGQSLTLDQAISIALP